MQHYESVVIRSANLILSLFNLMIHSNIPDICLESDKTVKKVSSCILDIKAGPILMHK